MKIRASSKWVVLLVLLASVVTIVHAQASPETYVVRSVRFEVRGITSTRILASKADIAKGTEFAGKEAFERFLAERRQRLLNERVLAAVNATYTTAEVLPGRFAVDILFSVADSWNLVALPYFRYDTNDGFLLSVRGRDYNFLGSMTPLVLNLDYTIDELQRPSYGGYTNFSIPFSLKGNDANVTVAETLKIHADGRPVTSISNLSGYIVFQRPGYSVTLAAGQTVQVNPDEIFGDTDPVYFGSSGSISGSIPVGLSAGRFGRIHYSPYVGASSYWRFGEAVRADRRGPGVSFSHGLSFGRADWIENMRDGLSASLSNTDSYNFTSGIVTIDADASLEYHATDRGRIGFNGRFLGFHSFTGVARSELGVYMRGIMSTRVWGSTGAFLSLEAPVKLFDFPTHLIIGKNWLDFELQASPFVDLGYCDRVQITNVADRFWYSGGMEFIVYPLRMRTFIVRASAGFDLDSLLRTGSPTASSPRDGASPYELYFGLGLFF